MSGLDFSLSGNGLESGVQHALLTDLLTITFWKFTDGFLAKTSHD